MNELKQLPKEWLQPHPVLALPTREQVVAQLARGNEGLAELKEYLEKRAEKIRLEKVDPLRHGFEPETYASARRLLETYEELLLLGGNREGKTNFAAKYVMETLMEPGKIAACFHSSERSSIDMQQPVVHSFLPPEWRKLNLRTKDIYLSYSKATGFSNFKFILPNGSECFYYNYKQDVTVMEGYEFDVVWFDELVPMPFLESLTFRLSRERVTKILTTFTPVKGYTSVVAAYVAGAKVLETRRADLFPETMQLVKGCPGGHMPYTMEGRRPRSAIQFFHIGQNPYGASKEVRNKLEGASASTKKIRAYGWADKMVSSAFPKFGDANVVSLKSWEKLQAGRLTRYVSIDPGGAKNWFIKWYAVTQQGWVVLYREWPDHERYGEWALPPTEGGETRRFDWRPGPAQRLEAGRGISGYKRLILEAEGWTWDDEKGMVEPAGAKAETLYLRLIDPRMGGAAVPGDDEGTSIIEMAAEEQRDARGRLMGPAMELVQAPASRVDETVQMINELMDYDDTKPLSALNCPRFFVLETCKQSILAYSEFTGAGGEKDALKDIVDPDRYLVKANPEFVEESQMLVRGGGYY